MEQDQGSSPNPFAPSTAVFSPSPRNDQVPTSAASKETTQASASAAPFAPFARGRGGTRGNRVAFGSAASTRGHPSIRGKPFANRSVVFNADSLPRDNDRAEQESDVGRDAEDSGSTTPVTEMGGSFNPELAAVWGSDVGTQMDQSDHLQPFLPAVNPTFQSSTPSAATPISASLTSPLNGFIRGSKDSEDVRKRRFEDLPKQNRFFEMKQQRDALRLDYIRQGVLPDPDKAQDLSVAKSLQGTCMEMCPEFEREEREFQNEGDVLEMFPGTNRIDPSLAVKIYRRPAAGRELPLPQDVRPPSVLRQTLDYLFHQLLPSDPGSPQFTAVQPFMWNRTRAIRQDFIVQGLRGALEIECHERIARYHILCLHWKGGAGAEGWSEQQELEQLRKTIRSLTEFYEDMRRSSGQSSPNEAEFRAYNLLLHMQDPETLREVESLPLTVFDSPDVQAALRLRGFAQRSNNVIKRGRPLNSESTMNLWTRFFGEIRRNSNVSYLLACLAENAFPQVRAGAIKAMGKTYLSQHAPLPLEYLRRSLGMDDEEEARLFAVALNCEEFRAGGPESPVTAMRLGKANEERPLPSPPFSKTIVEVKRGSRSSQDIVDGRLSGAAPLLPNQGRQPVASAPIPTRPAARATVQAKIPTPTSKPPHSASPPVSVPFLHTPTSSGAQSPASFTPSAFGATLSATASVFTPSSFSSAHVPSKKAGENVFARPAGPAEVAKSTTLSPFSFAPSLPTSATQPPATKATSSSTTPAVNLSAAPTEAPAVRNNEATAGMASDVGKKGQGSSTPVTEPPASRPPLMPVQSASPATVAKGVDIKRTPPPPEKPKRTVASVASSLADLLINDFIERKVETMSQQACLREMRIRRKDARSHYVKESAERLMESLRGEVTDDLVGDLASLAIADEFRVRSLEALALHGRNRAVNRALERKRQAERLAEVRSKLEERGLAVGHGHDRVREAERGHSKTEDHQLRLALAQASDNRRSLWNAGTFLHAIEQRFDQVAPPIIDTWSVALSVCKEADATAQWLRLKMSLDAEPEMWGQEARVQVMDLERVPQARMAEERDVGMVVFELSASLTTNLSNKEGWMKEQLRLDSISRQAFVTHSRFHPKLLLLAWTANETAQEEERRRKAILGHLRLNATDPQRFQWSKIEVVSLGSTAASPQTAFEAGLRRIMDDVTWNQKRLRFSLEGVGAICKTSWKGLVEQVQAAILRLDKSGGEGKKAKAVAVQAFNTITILCSRSLGDLVDMSDTLADDEPGRLNTTLPLAPQADAEQAERGARTVTELVQQLALVQLEECHRETNDDSFLLVQSWLIEQSDFQPGFFPWLAYFEQLYQWYSTQIEDVWLECRLADQDEIKEQCLPTTRLCKAAWAEIEWKLKDVMQASSARRKRGGGDDGVWADGGANKLRRVEAVQSSPPPLSTPSPPAVPSSRVKSLRALMASAAHMLDDRT